MPCGYVTVRPQDTLNAPPMPPTTLRGEPVHDDTLAHGSLTKLIVTWLCECDVRMVMS